MRAAVIYHGQGRDLFYYDEIEHIPDTPINRKHTIFYLDGAEVARVSDKGSYRLLPYHEIATDMGIIPPVGFKKY